VPHGEVWVVDRMGKYSRTLNAGVHVLVPGLDSVKCVKNAHMVSMGVTVPGVQSKDGKPVDGYAVVHFTVVDPQQVCSKEEEDEEGTKCGVHCYVA
jgi:regulator of protease activity HflC (stomatin/prohibitin superfamily)